MSDKDKSFQPPDFSKEEFELADAMATINMIIYGENPDGDDIWAYLAIPPSKLHQFEQAAASNSELRVEDYGEILKQGYGKEPDDSIKKYMEDVYGVNHNFEEQVMEIADEINRQQRLKEKYAVKKESPLIKKRDNDTP